jgi:hypothetical protein
MQSCEEFHELAAPDLYMIVTACRQNSTPSLLVRPYAVETSTHPALKYRGLSLLLDVVLGSTCRCVYRHGALSHGHPSAPEHEIAARSTLAVNNANVLGRIAITILAHTRAKGQPL